MRLTTRTFLVLLMLLTPWVTTVAEVARSKGTGSVMYEGWFGPSKVDKANALHQAKVSALERHMASSGNAMMQNYERMKHTVLEDIDSFILDHVILSEDKDKEAKRYTIVIRANVNASRLATTLQSNSAVANTSAGDRSYMTFVFVAREQKSAKRYQDKVYKRVDTGEAEDGSEYESASRGGLEYVGEKRTSRTTTSGGSITRKADKIEYDVSNAGSFNTAMSQVFTEAGFEVVEAEYLVEETGGLMSVEAFKEDYRHGDDISGGTRRSAVKGLRDVRIPYMAIGTLDVGMRDKDAATGMTRVSVSVTGKVLDLRRRFPRTVASVGPVVYAGLGNDQTEARDNALKIAAANAADTLTQQMNSKAIH